MNNNQHYTGLTDAQVLESREKYGLNILTPPEKETLWDRLRKTCTHWIPLSLAILVAITVVAAALLTGRLGQVIWVMPAILLLATLFIIVVGFFGGFKDPLFRILITAFVLSIGISIYEFEWAGASFSTFFEPIGIIVALLLATGVAYFLERSNEKTFQSLNKVNDDTPVKVIRNDNVSQVARRDIVVGDIVIVETGEEVPLGDAKAYAAAIDKVLGDEELYERYSQAGKQRVTDMFTCERAVKEMETILDQL